MTVPAGVTGALQVFLVDADNYAGGRDETVYIGGKDVGTFSNFQQGRWVTANLTAADTASGQIDVEVDNARQGSNVAVSEVAFAATSPVQVTSFAASPTTAQPGQQASFQVQLTNNGNAAESGTLNVSGPDGWTVTPATQDYSLNAGATQTFTVTTTNPGVEGQPLTFTASTTPDGGLPGAQSTTTLFTGHLRCLTGYTPQPVF